MKYSLLFFLLAVAFYSCHKETLTDSPAGMNKNYFPQDIGRWVIYDVDSVAHLTDDDATDHPDTSIATYHYQLKEVLDSSFVDGEGNPAVRLSRYKRMNDTLQWDFQAVWVENLTFNSAQRVEDNIRFVKLSFPIRLNRDWDGNAYNTYPEEDYSYSDIHVASTIGSLYFDSTITVLQNEDFNFIHRIFKQEIYANHVGMVYQQKDSLNINGIGQVTNGFEYKETVSSFGN